MTYAALAATDPSFLRALRALRGVELKSFARVPVNVSKTRRSSAAGTSSTTDTEVELSSMKAEEVEVELCGSTDDGSEERFTRQI
ncbi:hypothetical protein B0H16DRAFT_1711757 [Mycena metata]|uniref:Uncharacterized protein n=1 Tax=Mycena metata TaxID=1033252 RepID=A0AAD7K6I6_9AGAR|nr:hypothetical protein B0H16DRAFT_1711757 [Mycena metata]